MEGLSTQYNGHIINEIIYIEKFWENFNKNTTFKVKGHTCGNLKDIHLSIRKIRNILTIQSKVMGQFIETLPISKVIHFT